jgi:hypothetical protein
MIEVRVGDDDGIRRSGLKKLKVRNRGESLVFRVHSGIQHHLCIPCFKQIGIRTDTGVATEAFENHDKWTDEPVGLRMASGGGCVNPPAGFPGFPRVLDFLTEPWTAESFGL